MNLQFAARVQALALERAGQRPASTAPTPPVALLTTPLFHVSANNCAAYAATTAGGKIVLMHRWDAGEALRLIERERVTSLRGVPVMARELLNHQEFERHDTSSLQTVGGGGAPLPPDLVDRLDRSLAQGRPSTGYGLTETSGIIATVEAAFFLDKPTSVGRVMPTFEARIIDEAAREVEPGEIGELCVKGACVIKEYINCPDATAEAITDGWFHTGDIARFDGEGFLHIVDRKKDMVLRGGENIYCAEVEACLYREPSVAECCVFGVPDERLGEEVAAAVVLRDGEKTDPDALRAHCVRHIAKHKAPRYFWITSTPLPRNANGKFQKREVRSAFLEQVRVGSLAPVDDVSG
jgi:long-chain acyl-CoA synthetase